jgi:exodeoxyribonuclease-1
MAAAPSSAPTFFWHDYETFGRVPRRDRPAQFAGVRTDEALNELEPPVMWHCQPAPDTLPDPESVLITGITPQHALAHGVAEHTFAARIEAELARPGTIGCGYNSLRFDDEVTRFLFWRNLIDPYAREWRDGCSRWDLLDTVRACWALRPQGLQWPQHPDGRPSFRLEDLTRANGVAHVGAHDALADVRATLALARRVRAAQPKLWAHCLKLRHKQAVLAEIGVERPFVHVSGRYATERGCLAIVWPLAPHPKNKNELIVWDLAHDPAELATLDAAAVRQRLFSKPDELPEGMARLPIKTVHINKSPVVAADLRVLQPVAARWQIDVDAALRHAEAAQALGRLDGLWREVYARPAPEAPPDVDEDLYGGFVSDPDRRQLERLRRLAPEALAAARPAFEDGRLDELLFRYLARNFPQVLDENGRERWHAHCAARLHEGAGGVVPLAQWLSRIDELAEQAAERDDERAQALLEALVDHAEAIAPDRA